MLLRKHEFTVAPWDASERAVCPRTEFIGVSWGEGSLFIGGFAEFSLAAGIARAEGNHVGSTSARAFAGALFASVRATDWRELNESVFQTFGATVRLAREWVVESATSEPMRRRLEQQSVGLLSPVRRSTLLSAIDKRDWPSAWQSLSISDEFFLGTSLAQDTSDSLWTSPAVLAMKELALRRQALDVFGQVAPDLSGSGVTRICSYEPYEAYERYYMPQVVAQRAAELKIHLAWLADSSSWQPDLFAIAVPAVADMVAARVEMRDGRDWRAALEEYRRLRPENIELLLGRQ
jgi:hypothetical protein